MKWPLFSLDDLLISDLEASAKTSTDLPPASASVNALNEAWVDPKPQVDPQAPSDLEDWGQCFPFFLLSGTQSL